MSTLRSPEAGGGSAGPSDLAEQLDELATGLAKTLREAADAAAPETVQTCPQRLARASSALRGMTSLFEAGRADALARGQQEFSFILSGVGDGLRDLGEANKRIAAGVGDQIRDLDAISKLPPGPEVVAHLRQVACHIQQVAAELEGCLGAVAAQVESARERIAALQSGEEAPHKPDLYDRDTRLYSRAALEERLGAAVAAGTARGPWSLLLADIDGLGEINQRFGRLVGDALIFKIARIIEERLQEKCPRVFLARYDGGCFAAMLPGRLAQTLEAGESLREDVAAARWQYRGKDEEAVLEATISFGATPWRRADTVASLTQRAENALRAAKQEGGNQGVGTEA